MNLATVLNEIGDALDTIDGLRVFRYPPGTVAPPAAVVGYPDRVEFDRAYGRGVDRVSVPVVVLAGNVTDRTTSTLMAAYASGSGAKSIKAVVDGYGAYTEADEVTVTTAEFDVYAVGGVDLMAAVFEVDVVGQGA